jgi:hypothetical protein
MRTIRTGRGEGTTRVARNVDAAVEAEVDDGDGAVVADAEADGAIAGADARSRITAKASSPDLPLSGTGCSAVSRMRLIMARPARATQQARTRPRLTRRRMRCNLPLLVSRATPGSIVRSRAGDDTPGLQFHRGQCRWAADR